VCILIKQSRVFLCSRSFSRARQSKDLKKTYKRLPHSLIAHSIWHRISLKNLSQSTQRTATNSQLMTLWSNKAASQVSPTKLALKNNSKGTGICQLKIKPVSWLIWRSLSKLSRCWKRGRLLPSKKECRPTLSCLKLSINEFIRYSNRIICRSFIRKFFRFQQRSTRKTPVLKALDSIRPEKTWFFKADK